jgi:polyhydroxybutyrate depolymerase
MKSLCVLCLSLLATVSLSAQQMLPGTLQVNGVDRTYLLHVPAGDHSGKPLPLVLALHGAGMTSALMATVTGLNTWADKTGFIVVYPEGLENHWNVKQTPGTGIDDFVCMKQLLTKIESTYSIDRSRVIATGYSNGAGMSQIMGCTGNFQFKAIVAVSATLPVEAASHCTPIHTVRLIEFHGTADPIVPYLGGRANATGGSIVISVADDLQLWARINHCEPEPKTERLPDHCEDGTHVERVTFHGCAAGGEVTHYRILGGGHVWPGNANMPKIFGQTTQQIDASQYIAHLVSDQVEP